MHVGLVFSGGEKMSKSLGNVVWSRDVVNKHGQNLLRLHLFSRHYREDMDFEEDGMEKSKPLLEKVYAASLRTSYETDPEVSNLVEGFSAALDDDLDSPRALGVLDDACTLVLGGARISSGDLEGICRVLGLRI